MRKKKCGEVCFRSFGPKKEDKSGKRDGFIEKRKPQKQNY